MKVVGVVVLLQVFAPMMVVGFRVDLNTVLEASAEDEDPTRLSSHGSAPRSSRMGDLRSSMVIGAEDGQFKSSVKASGMQLESFTRESGAVKAMNKMSRSMGIDAKITDVVNLKTPVSFIPNNEELATGADVINKLVSEIADEQAKISRHTTGRKFIFCAHVGTTQTEGLKVSRPGFIEKRGENFKGAMEAALAGRGVGGTIAGTPFEHFNTDRFANLVMKAYKGEQPPCFKEELNSNISKQPSMQSSHHSRSVHASQRQSGQSSHYSQSVRGSHQPSMGGLGGLSAIDEERALSQRSHKGSGMLYSSHGSSSNRDARLSSHRSQRSSQGSLQESGMIGGISDPRLSQTGVIRN